MKPKPFSELNHFTVPLAILRPADGEWAVVSPLLPVPGWMRGRGGRPEAYYHRAMLDAMRYLVDNGIKWRAMPADFPPWDRVYAFFRRWRDHWLVKEFHDRLRARIREGRTQAALPDGHRGTLTPRAPTTGSRWTTDNIKPCR
ncbi:transposase [Streptomyces sp. DSM 3412]|uniref:Transposase n=1 Tax=Streptomyces gottesmaniae TaxID=3075518 RepID=A0ABU2YRS5_9ACTN|nr:transposase [Streptomyces sp. DSM 3412]MDT0567024.1 transposase [Streptomyces sp. DSM 3412]